MCPAHGTSNSYDASFSWGTSVFAAFRTPCVADRVGGECGASTNGGIRRPPPLAEAAARSTGRRSSRAGTRSRIMPWKSRSPGTSGCNASGRRRRDDEIEEAISPGRFCAVSACLADRHHFVGEIKPSGPGHRIAREVPSQRVVEARWNSPGRAYYDKKTGEGKTHKEALRPLKRRVSDAILITSSWLAHQPPLQRDINDHVRRVRGSVNSSVVRTEPQKSAPCRNLRGQHTCSKARPWWDSPSTTTCTPTDTKEMA